MERAWSPPPPQVLIPIPPRHVLIPVARCPHSSQGLRYAYDISQAPHQWNLLASALGIIPCAQRIPPDTDPSLFWREVHAPERKDADAVSQEVDTLYPDEDPEPEPSTEPSHGCKHPKPAYYKHFPSVTQLKLLQTMTSSLAETQTKSQTPLSSNPDLGSPRARAHDSAAIKSQTCGDHDNRNSHKSLEACYP